MLCRQGEGQGPSSLFASFGQQSKCGVYLLSSGLSVAVKLFTNCKGTTVPYFFITRSLISNFMFSLPLKSLVHLCYYIVHINCIVTSSINRGSTSMMLVAPFIHPKVG